MLDEDAEDAERARSRVREASRSRSKGYKRELSKEEIKGVKTVNKLSKKWRTQDKKGESDRFIGTAMPRHLYSGKTSKGSRDYRWFTSFFRSSIILVYIGDAAWIKE